MLAFILINHWPPVRKPELIGLLQKEAHRDDMVCVAHFYKVAGIVSVSVLPL